MSFLAINGITAPVAIGSYEETPREIGSTGPAFDGTLRKSRITRKRDVAIELAPLLLPVAKAWDGLLAGLGEVWSWDSTHYGSKGLGPDSTVGSSLDASQSVFGGQSLKIPLDGAGPAVITYQTGLGADWTAIFWAKVTTGNPWQYIIQTSGGLEWEDGLPSVFHGHGFSVVGGASLLTGSLTEDLWLDDLVILPFVIPSDWPAQLYAYGAPFPPLPQLAIAGDGVSTPRNVMGAVTADDAVAKGGARMRLLKATLQEV